jgi:hypothetical protein
VCLSIFSSSCFSIHLTVRPNLYIHISTFLICKFNCFYYSFLSLNRMMHVSLWLKHS